MILEFTPEEIEYALFALYIGLDYSGREEREMINKIIDKFKDAQNDIEHNKKINDANN